MVHEVKEQHYRGVFCSCCREPIPLPAILIDMELTAESGGDHSERAFTLRCRACHKEMPYRMSEVLEIEGEPRPRISQSHRSKLLWAKDRLSRAANA